MKVCENEEHGGARKLNGGRCNLGALPHELLVATVPIDYMFCEMMTWASRYAIGRRTYAASDTARYLLKLVDKLDMQTLRCLRQDIETATSLGDDCDEREWLKLLDAVKEELERRDNGDK